MLWRQQVAIKKLKDGNNEVISTLTIAPRANCKSEGVNLVPNDQVSICISKDTSAYLVPNDQEVKIGN